MKISVNAPSYRRPTDVKTLAYIPYCRIWVCVSEAAAYRKNYPKADIVAVPKGVQGNVSRIRNYILDHSDDDVVCIIDDDLSYLAYHEKCEKIHLKTREIMPFLAKYSVLALDWRVKMWGMNVNNDKQCYREYTPFSLSSYIGSPFSCHLRSDLRYDENLPLKEDYDMTLQHLNKYRKALRLNKYFYCLNQGGSGSGQEGGCAVGRNVEREKKQLELLRKKWGSKIIAEDTGQSRNPALRASTTKKRSYDVNPILRVPIKGV